MLGLNVVGKTNDDHATIYKKVLSVVPDWRAIRKFEAQSKLSYRMDCWRKANVDASPLRYKLELMRVSPMHYPRKVFSKLSDALRGV